MGVISVTDLVAVRDMWSFWESDAEIKRRQPDEEWCSRRSEETREWRGRPDERITRPPLIESDMRSDIICSSNGRTMDDF